MLPYGDLRESSRNMDRADIILITKSPENISPIQRRIVVKDINKAPYQNLYFTTVTYKDPLPVFKETEPEQQWFESGDEKGAVLVTGIANPKPLEDYLQKTFKEIIHLSYGDHHSFTQKDIDKITKAWNNLKSTRRYILTTEKDSVRLREFSNIAEPFRSSFYYIPVGIAFLNNDKKEFDNLILDYVRKNKRNNRIS
jgi:tetraacyldisaccharide 4'-kinase